MSGQVGLNELGLLECQQLLQQKKSVTEGEKGLTAQIMVIICHHNVRGMTEFLRCYWLSGKQACWFHQYGGSKNRLAHPLKVPVCRCRQNGRVRCP